MTTKELVSKLKSYSPALPFIKGVTPEKLGPFFTIAGAILQTKELIDGGFEASFSEIILPHLMLTFGPSLIANSLYPRFKVTQKDIVVYFVGFIISLFVSSNRFIMYFVSEVPYFSRFFTLVKLKNTNENIVTAIHWIITSKIVGMCLNRMIFKKKLKLKIQDALSLILTYGGIFLLRKYKFNDYYVIIIACIVPLTFKAVEYLCESQILPAKRTKKETKNETVKIPRKQTRKASLSAKLEKSK